MVVLLLIFVGILACVAWSFTGYNETIDVRGKSVFISGCEYVSSIYLPYFFDENDT
jgi:hypothetical protein